MDGELTTPTSAPASTPGVPNMIQSARIAGLLNVLGDEFGFDRATCSEISDLRFGRALQVAYGYLAQAGFDADDVLAPWIDTIV